MDSKLISILNPMFEKRKLLMKTAYETAKKELKTDTSSDTAILGFLSQKLEDQFGSSKDERTFVRYYKRLVKENQDYNIDDITLDQLSKYLGYKNFEDFSENYKIEKEDGETKIEMKIGNDEDSLSEKLSKIIINITNTPVFNVPQLAKNGIGIGAMVMILIMGFAYGGELSQKNECMYWDGDEYKKTSCNDKNPKHQLLPIDTVKLKYFKKITRPDTLTVENGFGNSWYTKYDNTVEFFTMDGINPDNGKSLTNASKHMITKYAGANAELETE
ncbi:hypothetical protein QFZ37_000501 [Chryseobacterium ginsenosidimutans]|uniref:hypothetical protein n=1 Tax=Chryseobacterium ginsenosidimutans TaxID=687846 RepID=UPI00278A7C1D|nr:hypothetical protein [Chryseobacterium ginsenosidimutans]MDQ0592132.1 hypothetical protein [Chryseobacterium ginsenosidimutans]